MFPCHFLASVAWVQSYNFFLGCNGKQSKLKKLQPKRRITVVQWLSTMRYPDFFTLSNPIEKNKLHGFFSMMNKEAGGEKFVELMDILWNKPWYSGGCFWVLAWWVTLQNTSSRWYRDCYVELQKPLCSCLVFGCRNVMNLTLRENCELDDSSTNRLSWLQPYTYTGTISGNLLRFVFRNDLRSWEIVWAFNMIPILNKRRQIKFWL